MYIVHSPTHQRHQPPYEIFNGEQTPHNEVPARADQIANALTAAGYGLEPVRLELDLAEIENVHDSNYLQFLKLTCEELKESEYRYPSVFLYRSGRESGNPLAQLGNYSFDMYTPLLHDTFEVASQSAACALQVAQTVLQAAQAGEATAGYALCRPPGHHAEFNQMGGYCYLNNAAIVANFLSAHGRVATLDVDFHHGNGTQHIFYESDRVFTASIHADPDWKFPFFSGYGDERGRGKGRGYNLNRPLQHGVTDDEYQQVLEEVLGHISSFRPEFLVVSLGVDTHESDPIGGFRLTTAYYTRMAKTIASMNLPSVIVQEGGYNTKLLGTNVVAFLDGFEH